MTATITAALIALFSAVTVGFLTQFVAEDYRRFRDGSTLAAGLAGELGSYEFAFPILQGDLASVISAIKDGRRKQLTLRPFERPVDVYFDKTVDKIGSLGTSAVEGVVFVYSNLRAFRLAMEIATSKHEEMSDDELLFRFQRALGALDRAAGRGIPLVAELRARAAASFRPRWPWSERRE